MILTNRHHHTRWSLEQNQQVSHDSVSKQSRRSSWTRIVIGTVAILLSVMVSLWIMDRLWRDKYWAEGDEDLVDSASIMVNEHHSNEALGVLLPVEPLKVSSSKSKQASQHYAYCTLLCDNGGLPNARVLAYALQRAKSAFPLIVMTLPQATEGLEDLITLGATIERIPMVPVPFKRPNGKRPSHQKQCRYSKIHAWSLTKYHKLVYLDPNLLIVSVS